MGITKRQSSLLYLLQLYSEGLRLAESEFCPLLWNGFEWFVKLSVQFKHVAVLHCDAGK